MSRWYRHHPDTLVETNGITMMWNTAIPTAKKIGANHPDICFRNRNTNTCLLIDISLPVDDNIARKQAEKLAKYSNLWVEVKPHVTVSDTGCSSGVGSVWAWCTQVLHGGWTSFQVITTCSPCRKLCFLDPVRSSVKSSLLSRLLPTARKETLVA